LLAGAQTDFKEILRPSDSGGLRDGSLLPTSVLCLSDELILNIFKQCCDVPTSICLALSCKRLCSIYQSAVDGAKRREITHLWAHAKHSKRRLLAQLADGWIPRDRIRVCWSCFRFRPYGESARSYWQARFQCLNAQCTKAKNFSCDQEGMCWLGYPIKHPRRYNPWPSLVKHDAATDPIWTNVQSWDEEVRCPECVLWGFEIQLSGKIIKKRNQHWAALTQQGRGSDAVLRAISFYQ
jgi:hypothetical protein